MDTFLPDGFNEIFEMATKELTTEARIRAVLAAYDRALGDAYTHLPSYLHAAIEGLRRA